MPWPFRVKRRRRPSFAVASYRLDTPIGDLTRTVEFSAEEYATMGRQFQGERSYNAPPVHFLGHLWSVMLQTVNGQISKIAPYIELTSKPEANRIAMETLQFCVEQLGTPAEQKPGFSLGIPPMAM